jgi:hypothetical protein
MQTSYTPKPFDLAFFAGPELVSSGIRLFEKLFLTDKTGGKVAAGAYSHVGMIVTSEILEHPNVLPGKTYIFESTMGGHYGQQQGNIDNMENVPGGFLGVQIRNLTELVPKYLAEPKTAIAIGTLLNNPIDLSIDKIELKEKFTEFYKKYNGITYDANLYSLASAAIPLLRPFRHEVEHLMRTEQWLFCSEFVAVIYKHFGILSDAVDERNVLPMDFAGYDSDEVGVNGNIQLPLIEINKCNI